MLRHCMAVGAYGSCALFHGKRRGPTLAPASGTGRHSRHSALQRGIQEYRQDITQDARAVRPYSTHCHLQKLDPASNAGDTLCSFFSTARRTNQEAPPLLSGYLVRRLAPPSGLRNSLRSDSPRPHSSVGWPPPGPIKAGVPLLYTENDPDVLQHNIQGYTGLSRHSAPRRGIQKYRQDITQDARAVRPYSSHCHLQKLDPASSAGDTLCSFFSTARRTNQEAPPLLSGYLVRRLAPPSGAAELAALRQSSPSLLGRLASSLPDKGGGIAALHRAYSGAFHNTSFKDIPTTMSFRT